MTDKCIDLAPRHDLFLLGHTANWMQLPTVMYYSMLALTSFVPLRNPALFATFKHQWSIHAWLLYRVAIAYNSRPILAFFIFWLMLKKHWKHEKMVVGGIENIYAIECYNCRVWLSHRKHACVKIHNPWRSADAIWGDAIPCFSFIYENKWKMLQNMRNLTSADSKIYIFHFLDPFGCGLNRYWHSPKTSIYFVI